MEDLLGYFHPILLISPLIFYIIAVAFRLLDNSGFIFLEKEIIVNSSYVSLKDLKTQLALSKDYKFQKKIKRILVYRKLHKAFLGCMVLSIPVTIYTWFFLF